MYAWWIYEPSFFHTRDSGEFNGRSTAFSSQVTETYYAKKESWQEVWMTK